MYISVIDFRTDDRVSTKRELAWFVHRKLTRENDRRSISIGNIIPITAVYCVGAVCLVYTVIREPTLTQPSLLFPSKS